MRRWGKFLLRRAARTYPLYLSVLLPTTAYAAALGPVQVSRHLPEPPQLPHPAIDVAANLALVQSWGVGPSIDGTAWSLSTEWAAYYLFPLLAALVLFSSRRVAVGFALGAIGLTVATVLLTRYDGAHHSGPLDAYNGATSSRSCAASRASGSACSVIALLAQVVLVAGSVATPPCFAFWP